MRLPVRVPSFIRSLMRISSKVPSLTSITLSKSRDRCPSVCAKVLSCVTSRASVPPENPSPGDISARLPIRSSRRRALPTATASAPSRSQRPAISLMNAIDVARNALIACFTISALRKSIVSLSVRKGR